MFKWEGGFFLFDNRKKSRLGKMNEVEITSCLITELAKLVLRSEEKNETIKEGALKFLNSHSHAFPDVKTIVEKLENPNRFDSLMRYLFGEEKEPYYLPFTPGNLSSENTASGFLVHIFKGEQDIVPLAKDKITITPKQYYRLFHTLRHDLKRLENPPTLETWLYLLQRYTKWIPAGSLFPYVSLYSYARTKMALRASITDQQLEEWWGKYEAKQPYEEPIVALYALKIFGKSDFLAHLNLQSNLNRIKGGMYYYQMVREHLIKDFLKSIDLPLCNCLFEGDDKFLLLIPKDTGEKVARHQLQIEEFLLKHFGGLLGLSSCISPLTLDGLKKKDFAQIWESLWQRVEQSQFKPFGNYLKEHPKDYTLLLGPMANDKNSIQACSQSCEDLGDSLAKARWISIIPTSAPENLKLATHWNETMSYFNAKIELLPKKPETQRDMQIYRYGNTDFACPQGVGFKFSETLPYLMSEQPMEQNISYWAVLNIRIDNKQNSQNHSLLSYLTTHEYLQDFFMTYLASLLREKKYRKYTYMLYTADEYLTIVCSPQIALTLLNQISQKFRQFTDDKFTLSARISVFPSEYPLSQELLQEEKKFALQSNLYNRIIILEEIASWSFLESILRTQEKLSTIAKLKGKRFLFSLWGITERYRIQAKKSRTKRDSQVWRHMMNYYLVRLGITDNLEIERGPVHLSMAIRWNHLMSQQE